MTEREIAIRRKALEEAVRLADEYHLDSSAAQRIRKLIAKEEAEAETVQQELRGLVQEWRDAEPNSSERQEAWNLIADCVVERIDEIAPP